MLDRFKGQLLKNGAVSRLTQEKGAWPAVSAVSEAMRGQPIRDSSRPGNRCGSGADLTFGFVLNVIHIRNLRVPR